MKKSQGPSRRSKAKPQSGQSARTGPWRLGAAENAKKRAETALERSERRYKHLVENSLGLICTHDLEGSILSVNPAAAESLGYSPQEGPGRSLKDFLAPDTRHLFDEYLKRVRENKSDVGLMRVRAKNGTERIWMYRNTLYQEPNGPAYVLGHALDVTERVLAERALRESQRQLSEAYAQLEARVQQRTAELRHANSRLSDEMAERLRAEELREHAIVRERNSLAFLASATEQLMMASDYEQVLAAVARVPVPFLADWTLIHLLKEDGTTKCLAGAHVEPDRDSTLARLAARWPTGLESGNRVIHAGTQRQIEIVPVVWPSDLLRFVGNVEECAMLAGELGAGSLLVVPLILHDTVVGTLILASRTPQRFTPSDVAIVEDLARRFRLAAERVQLYREAQEANRLKDEFLATLSHELRTPLNAILGWAHLLQNRTTDAYVARALAVIERNAEAQTRLTEEILDVARIASGKFPLDFEPVDLRRVVAAALDGIRPTAQAKGVVLIEPADQASVFIRGDFHRLQQAVSNLLSNAVKFTPPGGTVTIALRLSEGHATLTVTDTGVGISQDILPFVFDRFRQADSSSTRAHGGLGLGLAIVRNLIDRHGGTVSAYSEGPGLGATFTVTLPVQVRHDRLAEPGSADRAGARPAPIEQVLRGRLLLVVDDQADARDLISEILRSAGAEVVAAATSQEALDAVKRSRPQLIVADIGLPEEDGCELIRRVRGLSRERGGRIPAIALTAYARMEDRARALAAGFQQYLVKPVDPDTLVRAVADALAMSSAIEA